MDSKTPRDALHERARRLGFWSLVSRWDQVRDTDWIGQLIESEEQERAQRSLDRRIRNSKIGRFKPMVDFDWQWPKKIDRTQIEDLFNLDFIATAANVVLVGPNGVGKSMIAKNLAHQALMRGQTVLFTTAAQMLGDLILRDSSGLQRQLKRYANPSLLVIDEVGYLSYDNRHADLLFEVASRRYDSRATIITTNKAFEDWGEIFPSAGCVVSLVDRMTHHSEIVNIEGRSYRLKEAQEEAARKARDRAARRKASRPAAEAAAAP